MRTAESVLLTCWPPAPERAVRVDAQVALVDLDRGVGRQLGRDVDLREARLAAVRRVERAEAHQAVHAPLGAEHAVGVVAAHAERGRLQARLLARRRVEHARSRSRAARPSARTCAAASPSSPARRCRPAPALSVTIASPPSYSPENSACSCRRAISASSAAIEASASRQHAVVLARPSRAASAGRRSRPRAGGRCRACAARAPARR